ncbi:16S rRNA (cytosine(1402)-N(4))-methyltransferase RsmH [Fuchsiella alkaliacetigena]|uniref:16S rRNA (cytosine(1402)-N(4))-methyltransferase RsmH n=1 Tax=Fuchsiella alkaliacetigena TaxID=957042 RepID=UPI002009E59A|nr:16S rRNA (cytosine(1402)-N(4))-methyltransferase RsmH [Fuchsiella alkaliacetigena]MCK8823681.1 16S rRNA (cytosine(1402)-N(4))-methyltransferase RsmH [Fuchsiella alkaliacetigena]
MNFNHIPVLLVETIKALSCKKGGCYVDATLGGAGHALEIAKQIGANGFLIGIDRDSTAIEAARKKLAEVKPQVKLINDNFKNILQILTELRVEQVDGYLFDLGVSSHQLDTAERGFSYRQEAPLDMRMGKATETTAADLLNNLPQSELEKMISEYGEERWASRIAEFIIDYRQKKPIELTTELVDIIKAAIPAGARRKGPHPATRTFQALRIAVNNELEVIEKTIENIVPTLKVGGRIAIITFHSLEDRIVKHKFKDLARKCICPPDFPICNCDQEPQLKIITKKPIVATEEEVAKNRRARSAKLRVAEKI